MHFRLVVIILFALSVGGVLSCSPGGNRNSVAQSEPGQARAIPTPAATSGPTAVVKSTRANLREQPSRKGVTVATLEKGALLAIVEKGKVGPWYQVRDTDTGKSGWIHGNTITLVPDAPLATVQRTAPVAAAPSPQPRGQTDSGRSYINVDGVRVRSPTFSGSAPPGASARCRDGSYSFSLNRRGTCSHHGGVAAWL
jgi:uncharacterized protein YgiM (DUF1202 family)